VGTDIDRETFDEADDAPFQQRLEQCLSTLGQLLERPGFGVGPATLGAELELSLVDGAARPLLHNQAVRAAAADARVTVELDRFNLELNATPMPLVGRPFATLDEELRLVLGRVADAAQAYGGRPVLVGILPTLRSADLGARAISDLPRYRALNNRLRRLRHDPFRLRISGADPLELVSDDVALEGAATSFQVHLRVDPADFTRTYNAVQEATAPVLAVAGNSPILLGHRLWEETRIPLCKQSIDDRDGRGLRRRLSRVGFGTGWLRGGPLELFAEGVRLHQPLLPVLGDHDPLAGIEEGHPPPLQELRLHQGTVWRWNRPVYDPACGGHLRIEMRALPSGPTVIDMLANAALLVGLSLWLAGRDPAWTRVLSFERAEHNFYRAAQHGLVAELAWPLGHGGRLDTRTAAELVPELLPAARDGLVRAGVAASEADRLLEVIAARVTSGQTGAVWQRRTLAALEPRLGRERALAATLQRYLDCGAGDQPVHSWPIDR
jgi:gamma-glutamyl:cysteine ligase YbdK (ATP-grasp superfamily)